MNPTQHRGNLGSASNGAALSPNLWADFPILEIQRGFTAGVYYFEDFLCFRTTTNVNAGQAHWAGGYKLFGSDGAAVAAADEIGGAITLSSDGDNEGVSFSFMQFPFQISRSHKMLCFEARLKTSTITDTKHGWFVGLLESCTLSATVPITATGTLADQNLVGWHRLEGDGDAADFVYKANGVAQVTLGADAATLAADTYIKLGFRWNPTNSNKLEYFVNNLKIGEYTMASAAGTDFPNDVRMAPVFALLNATGTTPGNTTIDWMAAGQLR